jgi:pimeloyl-ACP methyl ester carboxylesterase
METFTMDVVLKGNGASRIVAVHGIQGTRAVWQPLADAMRDDATFVLPNLRGRGAAPRGSWPADYLLRSFASDLAQVINAFTLGDSYCLAGWSMGVTVVLATLPFLVHRPARIVLMSGSPALKELHWFGAREGAELNSEIQARQKRLKLEDAADHEAVAWTWQAIRNTDQRSMLGEIDIPTLIVHGAADDESPVEHAHWLLEGLSRARLAVIEGAGHSIPTTHTAEVAAAMRRFLSA